MKTKLRKVTKLWKGMYISLRDYEIQKAIDDNYAQKFGPNKFSAYQAITHWSTHYPSDSVNTRYDRERKVSNMAWFSQAA